MAGLGVRRLFDRALRRASPPTVAEARSDGAGTGPAPTADDVAPSKTAKLLGSSSPPGANSEPPLRRGRLAPAVASTPDRGLGGEEVRGGYHRFILRPEEALEVLPASVRAAFVHLREPELADAVEALRRACRCGEGHLEWASPRLRRNLSFGESTEVGVRLTSRPRPDGQWDVELHAPSAVDGRLSAAKLPGAVAWPRRVELSWPSPRSVDDVAEALHEAWAGALSAGKPSDEPRLRAGRERDFRRGVSHAHRQSLLRLFDELWPPGTRSSARKRAQTQLEARLAERAELTGREFLAALRVSGARGPFRAAAEKLSAGEGQVMDFSGRCRLHGQPVEELSAELDLTGRFFVEVHLDAPLRTDFRAESVEGLVKATETAPLSSAEMRGACATLGTALREATAEGAKPAFRLSPEKLRSTERPFLEHQSALWDEEKVRRGVLDTEGRPGPKHGFWSGGLVFHGNGGLRPEDVFREGIPAKASPEVFDIARHQTDDPRSGLRGGCISPETPAGFADEGGFVYALMPVGGALDLQILDHEQGSGQAAGASGETEFAFPSHQPAHVVAGAYPVGSRLNLDSLFHPLGDFIPNPNLGAAERARLPARLKKFFEPSLSSPNLS